MSKRIVVVSDVQAPFQNDRQVNSLASFIKALEPDDVYCVGDLFDLPMVSRWTRNRRGEFDGNIQEHIDTGRRIIEKLGIKHLKVGNHDRRVEQYIENYAPALSNLKGLTMESLFGLDELGCELHRELWEFAPNTILAHGDEGSLNSVGGMTALNLATKVNKSVVCSHTHRQGLIFKGSSFLGIEGPAIFGMEVGHMMHLTEAKYLRSGLSTWQAGFGVLDISNKRVTPQVVQMSPTGSFSWEGRSYEDGRIRQRSSK